MSIFDRRFRDVMLMDYNLKNQGGLLNGQQGATGGLLGGLSNINPNLLIGANILGQGIQGTDPFSAITPAVLQTAQIQQALTPKAKKPFAVTNLQTGKQELITDNQYAANPTLYGPAEKTPLMAASETEEQKARGKMFGEKLININKTAEDAIQSQNNIETLKILAEQPDLKTGFLGNLRTSAEKLSNELGLEFDFQNVGAAEVLSSTTGKIVLNTLASFKGAISDGERKFATDINVGLSMSKEGIKANLALMEKGNQIAIKYDEEANDWAERNGGLSKKDKVTGKTWSEFTNDFHKENPLITDDERKILMGLSEKRDQEFLQGNNVQTIDGKRMIMIDGRLFPLDE
jgi:hypothetical protein